MKTSGVLIKLGASAEAEFPESNKGDTPSSGYFLSRPIVGEGFIFYRDNRSALHTSFIVSIVDEDKNSITFKTNNSVYQLTFNLFEDLEDID